MIRNMHVPAYCPTVFGAHMAEYTGVVVLVKKVMDIIDADMSVVDEAFVAEDMLLISISISIFAVGWGWRRKRL